ncbi:cell division protein [Brevundimonas sp. Leaf363]|uniref:cell division protein FtsX n=1 Tax=Brevundimonas sp. Leaf363 TaxID=1736353 RepID=UPI0006FE8123|nr:FtsX-like permease family protein [Brevundimonas sp. Leaf363]KQS57653.1 cell division protein [Brevundimonas sp. Leaf363]
MILLRPDPTGQRWLGAVIAGLCFIACLAAVGAGAATRAAHGWAGRLSAEATVQVRPRVGETGPTAAARAAETLAGVDGVAEAEAMSRAQAEDLLRPWVGQAALADLSIPMLVTVRLDRDAPASAVTLSRALAEAGLDATVDDHSLWRGEVSAAAGRLTALALLICLITAGAAGAVIVYAVGADLKAQRDVVVALSLNGAADGQIAGLFQARAARLAAVASAAGTVLAALAVALTRLAGGSEGISPAVPVDWADLLLLSPCPLVAVTLAFAAARFATLRGLASGLADAQGADRRGG